MTTTEDSSGAGTAHEGARSGDTGGTKGGGNGLLSKLGWAAAILVPPSAVVGAWRDLVRHHAVLACALFLLYAVLLAVGGFVGGFVRDLVARRRKGWLDDADRRLALRFSRYDREYKKYLAASMRFMDQKGLSVIGPVAPELDEVFVDVSLALRAPGRIPADLLAGAGSAEAVSQPGGTDERWYIGDLLDRPQARVLAIVGAPGTGKTTLLRHVARSACLAAPGSRRRGVPVLLYLRSLVTSFAEDPRLTLSQAIRPGLGPLAGSEPPGWFEDRLDRGDCVVLLDGLDEVAEQDMRQTLVAWVEQQIRSYPQNDYVITSRPHGYRSTPVEGATVLQTRSFTDRQVTAFIDKWYLAVERHAHPDTGGPEDAAATATAVRLRAEEGAGDLKERLRAAPNLSDLTVNPLLLTMIANVHRFRGALPGTRSDLYREICQAMLWRRQESKQLAVEPRGTQKETVLRGLAFAMMERRVALVSRQDCTDILRGILPRVSVQLSAEEFLADVGTNGLLLERENGVFAFAHFTFQEYLAAEYIRDKAKGQLLADAVHDDWWRECTLLYAASADVGPIVAACLESGTVTALALAFDCAEEGNELDPGLRARLNDLLSRSALRHMTAEARSLMNGVTLTRRLRHVVRTAGGGRLGAAPVGEDVYGLFLLDCEAQGAHRQPDAPPVDGGSGRPVTGVRREDAVAFVRWVNGLVGGELRYRLPTVEETTDPAVPGILGAGPSGTDGYGFWYTDGGDGTEPRLWTPGAHKARSVAWDVLVTRSHNDFGPLPSLPAALLVLRARAALTVLARLLDHEVARPGLLSQLLVGWLLRLTLDLVGDITACDDACLGIGNTHVLDAESARVGALADTIAGMRMQATDRENLLLVLSADVERELSALARRLTETHPAYERLRRVRDGMDQFHDDLVAGNQRSVEQLLNRVTMADIPGSSELFDDEPVTSMRASVYRLATGLVLPQAATEFSARLRWSHGEERDLLWALFQRSLTNHLIEGSAPNPVAFDVDELPSALPGVLRELRHSASLTDHPEWYNEQLRTVQAHALPILRREIPPGGPRLRKARLAAACLAAEEHQRAHRAAADAPSGRWPEPSSLAKPLLHTAAALTWMEDRHTGATRPTETIVLAVD